MAQFDCLHKDDQIRPAIAICPKRGPELCWHSGCKKKKDEEIEIVGDCQEQDVSHRNGSKGEDGYAANTCDRASDEKKPVHTGIFDQYSVPRHPPLMNDDAEPDFHDPIGLYPYEILIVVMLYRQARHRGRNSTAFAVN